MLITHFKLIMIGAISAAAASANIDDAYMNNARLSPVNVSIRTDNNENFETGSPRVLACIVYGYVPTLNVTWLLGDTMLRPNVYKEVNRGNFTVSSLTFVPSLTDNGKDLVCKVTNSYMTEFFEDRVTIRVGHRPMCIDSGFKTIGAIEGESETLVCMVESDPEPEQFIWTFADGRSIYTSSKKVSGHEKRYASTLVWVPRRDDFGPLYCRASNRFGEQKQPCTFSVIGGGPPTTPECEIFWEDRETLKVRCDKNWDGGRPQTISLEIKGPEGTRKVSRMGHELKVGSLRPGQNFSALLYASSVRGRSPPVQLLPRSQPANLPPEHAFKSTPIPWTIIFFYIFIGLVCLLIFGSCVFIIKKICDYYEAESGATFQRNNEGIDMNNFDPAGLRRYTSNQTKDNAVSTCVCCDENQTYVTMVQPDRPGPNVTECDLEDTLAAQPRQTTYNPNTTPKHIGTAKISLAMEHYYI